jgi:hypothetical protein
MKIHYDDLTTSDWYISNLQLRPPDHNTQALRYPSVREPRLKNLFHEDALSNIVANWLLDWFCGMNQNVVVDYS